MKQITTSVLGFEPPISGVPETMAECIGLVGSEQGVVDIFVNHIRFHRTNSDAREAIVEALEKVTGVARTKEMVDSPTKADPKRKAEQFTESEQQYAQRAVAQSGQTVEQLAPAVLAEVGTIEFKAVGAPRTPGGKSALKVYTEGATKLISLGADTYGKAIATLVQSNPGITVETEEDGTPKVDSLAAALRTNMERVQKEQQALLGLVS